MQKKKKRRKFNRAKKHHNWQQNHTAYLKKYNPVLLAQMQHIQRLGSEVTSLRKKVASLEANFHNAKGDSNSAKIG